MERGGDATSSSAPRCRYTRLELLTLGRDLLRSKGSKLELPNTTWRTINTLGINKKKRGNKRPKPAGTDDKRKKKPQPDMRLCLLNARSLCNKALEVCDHITEHKVDLMCITETWYKADEKRNSVAIAEVTPPGYRTEHIPRVTGRGGGVAIIHKQSITVKLPTNKPSFSSFEHLQAQLIKDSIHFNIIVIYRPQPSKKNKTTFTQFIDDFSSLLQTLATQKGKLLILGDFNIHVERDDLDETKQLKALLDTHNLVQHVKTATHNSGHVLDLVISRPQECTVAKTIVANPQLSDHAAVTVFLPTTRPPLPRKTVTSRNYRRINIEELKKDINSSPLAKTLPSDPDELVKLYNSTLSDLIDKHAPLKTREVTIRPSAQWYSDDLHTIKLEKRKLERKWRKSRLEIDHQIFKSKKAEFSKAIRSAKRECIQEAISKSSQSQKMLFSQVNSLFNANNSPSVPSNISPTELPDIFADFFISKIQKIQDGFANCDLEVSNADDLEDVRLSGRSLHALSPTTQKEVRKIIVGSPSKSCSLDPIPTSLLKECLDELLPIITAICNSSLTSAHVPTPLKTAVITPILKKQNLDPDALGNYRPVSGLPFVSKILEKVVSARLKEHRVTNALYEPCQSAYRSGHSTETAVVKIADDVLRELDRGRCVFLVLLDLSAAFDTVSHQRLLRRLNVRFGLTGEALDWLSSYLNNRTQSVCVDGNMSSQKPLQCGVPQGSVLGPELFSDYSAPVMAIIRSHGISGHCYADDTQLYAPFQPGIDESAVLTKLQAGIESLRVWMKSNQLKLNDQKTEFIVLGPAPLLKNVSTKNITVGGQLIPCSATVRNIGAHFDQHMAMDTQISKLCKTAWLNIFNISKIRQYLSKDQTQTLVHAYVTSRLDQFNALLYGLPQAKLDKLRRVQHAAARLISGAKKFDHITPIMQDLHWLPINYRVVFKILLLAFKALVTSKPVYLNDLLTIHTPGRELRSSSHPQLSIPKTKFTRFGDRSFSVAAPKLWNSLPNTITCCTTVPAFKTALKTHLFKQAYN